MLWTVGHPYISFKDSGADILYVDIILICHRANCMSYILIVNTNALSLYIFIQSYINRKLRELTCDLLLLRTEKAETRLEGSESASLAGSDFQCCDVR